MMRLSTKKIACVAKAHFVSIIKYTIASFLSTGIDFLAFYLLSAFLFHEESFWAITCATGLARITSAAVNFLLNRNFVFRCQSAGAPLRYGVLVVCTMAASSAAVYGGVYLFHWIGGGPFHPETVKTTIKALVDTLLFLANYHLCRKWVFQAPQKKTSQDRRA